MWQSIFKRMADKLVQTGTLFVYFPDESFTRFGDGTSPHITLRMINVAALRQLVINPDLALGEAYMNGDLLIDDNDLHGLLQLLIMNLAPERRLWWHRLAEAVRFALRGSAQTNGHTKSRRNVEEHYDLSGELYDLFLDQDRQ